MAAEHVTEAAHLLSAEMEENREGSDVQNSQENAIDNGARPVGPFLRPPPVTSSSISLGQAFSTCGGHSRSKVQLRAS